MKKVASPPAEPNLEGRSPPTVPENRLRTTSPCAGVEKTRPRGTAESRRLMFPILHRNVVRPFADLYSDEELATIQSLLTRG